MYNELLSRAAVRQQSATTLIGSNSKIFPKVHPKGEGRPVFRNDWDLRPVDKQRERCQPSFEFRSGTGGEIFDERGCCLRNT